MKAALNNPEAVNAFREKLLSLGLEKSADMLDRDNGLLLNYTAFPSDQSLLRLAVSILMDINEEWLTGRKYLSVCGAIYTPTLFIQERITWISRSHPGGSGT